MSNTYKIKYQCSNCDKEQVVEFEKGRAVTSHYAPCDFCGCDSLVFVERVVETVTK